MSVEEVLEAIKKQLEDHEKRLSKLEAQPQIKEESVSKRLSVKELIISKKLKTDVDKTLVIGYYLEKNEGYDSFTSRDIENGYRATKEPVPANVSETINKNIRKGYMMDAKDKKDGKRASTLTNLGEQFVANSFEKINQ